MTKQTQKAHDERAAESRSGGFDKFLQHIRLVEWRDQRQHQLGERLLGNMAGVMIEALLCGEETTKLQRQRGNRGEQPATAESDARVAHPQVAGLMADNAQRRPGP